MPPRKRAASAPKSEPAEQGALEAPAVEDAPDETVEADDGVEAESAEAAAPESPAKPKPGKDKPDSEPPCTDCFTAGWPDDATSVGCGHGTWNRAL